MLARLILSGVAGAILAGSVASGVGYRVVKDKEFIIDAQAVTIQQAEERQTRVKAGLKSLQAAVAQLESAEKGS